MQTFQVIGGMDRLEACAIYAIIAEQDPGIYVVKIGMSSTPYQRFVSLLPGIPFHSRMHFAWVGGTHHARKLEARIHRALSAHRMHGEWFRIIADDSAAMEAQIKGIIQMLMQRLLEWRIVTQEQAMAWWNQTKGKRSGRPPGRPKKHVA